MLVTFPIETVVQVLMLSAWLLPHRRFFSIREISQVILIGGKNTKSSYRSRPYGGRQGQPERGACKAKDQQSEHLGRIFLDGVQEYLIHGIGLSKSVEDLEKTLLKIDHGKTILISKLAKLC